MNGTRRGDRSLLAFYGHRLSGIALALFLPLHFYVLSLALTDPARLDAFLAFTEMPLVKAAETGLLALLAMHLAFGARLLLLELFPWRRERDLRPGLVDGGIVLAVATGAVFLWVAL